MSSLQDWIQQRKKITELNNGFTGNFQNINTMRENNRKRKKKRKENRISENCETIIQNVTTCNWKDGRERKRGKSKKTNKQKPGRNNS